MKQVFYILIFFTSCIYAQVNGESAQVGMYTDTTWNHHIDESDLILQLWIEESVYVTDGGYFSGKVMKVIKGEFSDKKFQMNVGLIEFSSERYEKRLRAISPKDWKKPFAVYVGFKKTDYHFNLQDSKTQQKYVLFMSVEKM